MKKKIIIVIVMAIVFVVIFIGLTIVNSKDCTQFVIDTYEIHSGIDIPRVESINCYFDNGRKVRLSIYSLKSLAYHDRFLVKHKFRPVSLAEVNFPIALSEKEKPKEAKLYEASGTTWGNDWRYIVEKESNRLWAEIRYH